MLSSSCVILANRPISDCKLDPRAHGATAAAAAAIAYSMTSKVSTPATVPYSSKAFTSNTAAEKSSSGRDSALVEVKTPSSVKDPIFGELMDAR